MARPKTRPDPNVANPLAETSIQRRMWAAYLAKGYTRTSFSRELGVAFQTVDRWDQELSTPELPMFLKACELVGYTPNQICGINDGVAPTMAGLDDDELSLDERAAFANVVKSYADAIKSAFVASYRIEREAGLSDAAARAKAQTYAHQTYAMELKRRSVVDAVAAGGKPATAALTAELRTLGDRARRRTE